MKNRNFILLCLTLAVLFLPSNIFGDEKKTNQAINSYTNSIEKAENNYEKALTSGNIDAAYKRLVKELSSLDKKYERYSDEIKGNETIKSLNRRHLAINENMPKLKAMAQLQKVVAPYERKIKSLEKKYITQGSGDFVYLIDQLEILEKHYSYIPEESIGDSYVVGLKKRHDALTSLQSEQQTAYEDETKARNERSALIDEIETLSYRLSFNLLKAAKNNEDLSFTELKELEEDMEGLAQFAIDCKGKYAEIVAEDPKVKELANLAYNREKYRDHLEYTAYKRDLERRIERFTDAIEVFPQNKYIRAEYLDHFLYGYDDWCQEMEDFVTKGYSSLGKPLPTGKFKELRDLKPYFTNSLNNFLNSNEKFKVSGYKKPSDAFLNKVDYVVKERLNLELVEAGSEDRWYVERDDYDRPLRKYSPGYVLMKKSGEDFYRYRTVYFYKEFDGESYEEASFVQFVEQVTPVRM